MIELVELLQLTETNKLRDVLKFDRNKIKRTLKSGRSMKTTKGGLDRGTHQLFTPEDGNGNVENNTCMEVVVRFAEKFYTDSYRDQDRQEGKDKENICCI